MILSSDYKGFAWWQKCQNYLDYNSISPYFVNKKQAIEWYVQNYKDLI